MLLFQCAQQIQEFLTFVKSMYSDLPNHLDKIFEPKQPIHVSELSDVNLERYLKETFSTTPIQTEKKQPDGSPVTVSTQWDTSQCVCPTGYTSMCVPDGSPVTVCARLVTRHCEYSTGHPAL